MQLGKVMEQVFLAPEYSGAEKLFRVRALNPDGTLSETDVTARDTVGADVGDVVLLAEAEQVETADSRQIPTPFLIVGIVKNFDVMAREEILETSQERLI